MNLFNHKSMVLTAVAVCGLSIATQAAAAGRPDFVVAVQKNPPTLEPLRENSNVAMRVIYNVLDTLIDIDFNDNFKLIPGLATSWERIDGKTIEFKLRTGVKCHNGENNQYACNEKDLTSEPGPAQVLKKKPFIEEDKEG